MEMAADAVGADQHERVDGIARRLHDVGIAQLDALGFRGRRYFFADTLFGLHPLAVERGHQLAIRPQRPVRLFPGGAARAFDDVGLLVLQAAEKLPPFGIDCGGIGLVFGIEVFDVGGVAAVEERSAGKCGVGVLTGHGDCNPCGAHGPRGYGSKALEANCRRRCRFNSIYDACKSTKDLSIESGLQDFDQGFSDSGRGR